MRLNGNTEGRRVDCARIGRLDALLIVLIAAGVIMLLVPVRRGPAVARTGSEPRQESALPRLELVRSESGVEVARLDAAALQRWCQLQGLPVPPALPEAEPEVARTLLAAVQAAAAHPTADNLGAMGMISAGLGCYDSAAEYFKRASAAAPAVFRWCYYIGCVEQTLGEYDLALATFERAVPLDPEYAMTYGRMAEVHLWAGRLEHAAEFFRQYTQRQPADSLGHIGLARIALQRGAPAEALQHAQTARALQPRDFQVLYCLARAHAGLGHHEEARVVLDQRAGLPQSGRLEARDPLHRELRASARGAAALVELLPSLNESGDWQQLAALAEDIVSRRPGDVPMLANLAGYYRKLGRFAEAHAVLDRAEAAGPGTTLVRLARGELLLAQRRFADAAATAREALALDARSARAFNVLGRAEYMLGHYSAAAEAMADCTRLGPDNSANLLMLADALRAAGRDDQAAQHYRRVLELSPDDARARQALAEVEEQAGRGPGP